MGRLLVIAGVIPLAAGLTGIIRRVPAQAAGDVVAGLLLCGAGLVMLRRYRDPLLARARYGLRGWVPEALHPRRLVSAGLRFS